MLCCESLLLGPEIRIRVVSQITVWVGCYFRRVRHDLRYDTQYTPLDLIFDVDILTIISIRTSLLCNSVFEGVDELVAPRQPNLMHYGLFSFSSISLRLYIFRDGSTLIEFYTYIYT